MRINTPATLLATGLWLYSGGAALQAAPSSGKVHPMTKRFMTKAAQDSMAEVELGKLAQEKGQGAEVKNYGQKLVSDHTKANDELKALASDKGVTLPTSLGAEHKATKARLEKLSGAAFDRAFRDVMVADHQKAVALFRKQAHSGKDRDVKAWAAKTLPTLEEHLKMARDISQPAHRASR
jgi:putative membrane protein